MENYKSLKFLFYPNYNAIEPQLANTHSELKTDLIINLALLVELSEINQPEYIIINSEEFNRFYETNMADYINNCIFKGLKKVGVKAIVVINSNTITENNYRLSSVIIKKNLISALKYFFENRIENTFQFKQTNIA